MPVARKYLMLIRYAFRSPEKVALQEIGPRFTLKLRSLRKGIPAVQRFGDHPEPMEFLPPPGEEQEDPEKTQEENSPEPADKPTESIEPPKQDEYLWLWKVRLPPFPRKLGLILAAGIGNQSKNILLVIVPMMTY